MEQQTQGSTALKPEPNRQVRYTYADYKNWSEDERWELIDGVAYSMSAAPYRKHQGFSLLLSSQLLQYFKGKPCKVYTAPLDVFWTANSADSGDAEPADDEDTITQPDILVVCDPKKLIDKGIRGAPDFIIEVLSPSTAFKDLTNKRLLYEKHGVREYWLVNPDTFETTIYILKDGSYGLPHTVDIRKKSPVAIFTALELIVNEEDL